MNDDGKDNKNEGLDRFGYDPLDDIKPIDTSDYERSKDDTYLTPVDLGMEPGQKRRVEKAAPQSSLEKTEGLDPKDLTHEKYDLVHKGDYFNLTARDHALRSIIVGAGWEQRSIERDPIDLDLSCFLLDKTDMTRVDEDFIFYNNPTGCDGAVKLLEDSRGGAGEGDDERLFLDLNGVPFEIMKIVFSISIYDQAMKGDNFGDVRDMYLRIVNYETDEELVRFILPVGEIENGNGMYCAAMVREGPQWFFQPLAETVPHGGLLPIARKYGLLIAEDTG